MAIAKGSNGGKATPFIFGDTNPIKKFVAPMPGHPNYIAPPKTNPPPPQNPVPVIRKPSPAVAQNSTEP